MKPTDAPKGKFGAVLGTAPGNVLVYSSDYDTIDEDQFPDRMAYRSFVDGIFMGYKWQCVELARRWLYLNKNYIFDDVSMAYDIFRLHHVRNISDGSKLELHSFKNGARRRPEAGCLLIWDAVGEFETTGHVAVVTEVHDEYIRFVEQNVENTVWPEGRTFSRQLRTRTAKDGAYWIEPCLEGVSILGWVIQTEDDTYAEDIVATDKGLFAPLLAEVKDTGQSGVPWIDIRQPADAAYVAAYGQALAADPDNAHKYFCLSETAFSELRRATNELHHLFLRATDYVLKNEPLLQRFNLPPALWPKIHQSWNRRKNSMITGRFDFSISENGLKVYEYNGDSASCYLEAARLQSAWASHFGCTIGRDSAERLFDALVRAWKKRGIDDVLHIMQDSDAEETYHALFMKSAMEDAGISVKVLQGVSGLHWSGATIVDSEQTPIRRVWKTWAWETALDQVRDEIRQVDASGFRLKASSAPRLVDVLLRPDVTVHEPLWTLIPSNKAILPVMWLLFPDHPYLLPAHFELTDDLRKSGYAAKPIVGRSGENIVMRDGDEAVLRETKGRFGNRQRVYQSLCPLPRLGGMNVQVCTFSVAGSFGGACVRVDPSPVIKGSSDVMPLRIIPDDEYKRMTQAAADSA